MLIRFVLTLAKCAVVVMTCIPTLIILTNTFRTARWSTNILSSICNYENYRLFLSFDFASYWKFFSDPVYIDSFLTSIILSFACVITVVPIGFLMSVGLMRATTSWPFTFVCLPMFIPFVVKIYAWMSIADKYMCWGDGTVAPKIVIWLFCCYSYLPIAVWWIQGDLKKIDRELYDAASDLGAGPLSVLVKIILPSAMGSIISSASMISVLSFGEFVIADLLGAGTVITIGQLANSECGVFHDIPMSSVVSLMMLIWSLVHVIILRMLFIRNRVR